MLGEVGEYRLGDAGVKPGKWVSPGETGEDPGNVGERSAGDVIGSLGVSGSK